VASPSGEQFEIEHEDQRAVVVEVGGGLRTYTVGEREVLDGYDAGEMCSSGRGQVLVPWPNRIADGRYEFGGRDHQLAIDEPGRQSAIHGLVRWSGWNVAEREAHRLVVEHRLHPRPGYPFVLDLRVEYDLSDQGLRVETTATNVGVEPCPFGAGAHPYFLPDTAHVDEARLRLPARRVLVADENGTSFDSSPVAGTAFDFLQERAVGPTALDHCFADLERDDDGLARATLSGPETVVTLWMDDAYGYVTLYTGDDRPDVGRRSIAIEPMTCPPQAFRSGESVLVLDPGDTVSATWGLSLSPGA
jgi:aldose 1-epimerase